VEHFVLPDNVRAVLRGSQDTASDDSHLGDWKSLTAHLVASGLDKPRLPTWKKNRTEKCRFLHMLMMFVRSIYSSKSPLYVDRTQTAGFGVFWRGTGRRRSTLTRLPAGEGLLATDFFWGCGVPLATRRLADLKAKCAGGGDFSLFLFPSSAHRGQAGEMALVGLASLVNAGNQLGFRVSPWRGVDYLSEVRYVGLCPIIPLQLRTGDQLCADYSLAREPQPAAAPPAPARGKRVVPITSEVPDTELIPTSLLTSFDNRVGSTIVQEGSRAEDVKQK
jgi:hypothetical protein